MIRNRVYAVHLRTDRKASHGSAISPSAAGPGRRYPVQYSVDYPDRPLNRLTTFFRLVVVIPIAIVLSLVEGGYTYGYGEGRAITIAAAAA